MPSLFLPAGISEFFTTEEYFTAPIDPLAKHQRTILERLNNVHFDQLKNLVRTYSGEKFRTAIMYAVDEYGFNILHLMGMNLGPMFDSLFLFLFFLSMNAIIYWTKRSHTLWINQTEKKTIRLDLMTDHYVSWTS